jgi:hypothetical protein
MLYLKTKHYKETQLYYNLVGSASLSATSHSFLDSGSEAGSLLYFGSNQGAGSYSGSMQEIRLWKTFLSETELDQHALDFRSVATRNPYTISDNMLVQYKLNDNHNMTTYPYFNDYAHPPKVDASASGFAGVQFENVTKATKTQMPYFMGSVESSNKIRIGFESGSQSPNSEVLDIVFNPVQAINEDIVNDFALYDFNDAIGNPSDMYEPSYSTLDSWRTFYYNKLPNNKNLYAYIRFIRNFDQSIMDLVKAVAPERAKVWTGIVIEPTILERSKYEWQESLGSTPNHSSSLDVNTAY